MLLHVLMHFVAQRKLWKNTEYIHVYAFRDFIESVPILDTFHQLHTQVLITEQLQLCNGKD